MQINKKIIICTLLILTIFSITGCVNANDSLNETSIQETSTNEPVVSDSQNHLSDTNNPKENTITNNDKLKETNRDTKIETDDENIVTRSNDIYVSTTGLKDNDGKTKETATTLSNALEISSNGTTIHITEGTYKPGDLGTITDKTINITGEGNVILDGNNKNRIIYIGNLSKVVINNIKLINGYASATLGESGGLIGNSGDLSIINCIFSNSSSEKNGGAIYNAGKLIITDSTFENNYATECGGAIFSQTSGIGKISSLSIDNSIFKNNSAKGKSNYCGGAVYIQGASSSNSQSSINITNSLFENNKAIDYGGGAIEIAVTKLANIDNCRFINNNANGELYKEKSDYGGGAISFIGSYSDLSEILTITNSLFQNNSVNNNGGGAIYTRYAKVDIKESVLINNTDIDGITLYRRTTDMSTAQITANDNWWGSNDNPKSKINGGTLYRWAILTITNTSTIKEGETVGLNISLTKYTTGSVNGTMNNPIKVERPVLISTNLDSKTSKLVNGECITNYLLPSGLKIIYTIVDGEKQVLYVIPTSTSLELSNIIGQMGDRVNYTVKLKTEDNSIINIGDVEIYFDDDLVKTVPVENNEAKTVLVINKVTGNHTITAKFIDKTMEFKSIEDFAKLEVTGINNIVTNTTLNRFFDNTNTLLNDVPFDEIIFKGKFAEDKSLTITKKIKITGNNALFNNTVFNIIADNVKIRNITFIANNDFDNEAVVYSAGQNTIIENNTITYTPPSKYDSYLIDMASASNSQIINNNITYIANLGEDIKTIAINVVNSKQLLIKDNVFNLKLPSIGIEYPSEEGQDVIIYSAGLIIKKSEKLIFDNNTLNIDYTDFEGFLDTIEGLYIKNSDSSKITNNNIKIKGHRYTYPLYIADSKNIEIKNNNIIGESELDQTNTVSVDGKTSAIIDNNNITAKAEIVVYPIYLNDPSYTSVATLSNNNICGEANLVYGIYTEEDSNKILNNTIEINGNYTIGITSYKTDLTLTNNTINSKGTNSGVGLRPQSGVPVETTAITVSDGRIEVKNNKFISTGNYTINAINSDGNISDNNLILTNGATGDTTINQTNSDLIIDNNKTSQSLNPVKPENQTNNTIKPEDSSKKDETTNPTNNNKNKKTNAKPVITAKNLKVKKSAKTLKIKVTLKQNKKAIQKKQVVLKFRGKTYKKKTNKKGIVTFKISKKVLCKLKAGKSYNYTVKYRKYKLTKKISVKK